MKRTMQSIALHAVLIVAALLVAFPLFWALEVWIVWRLLGPAWALGFALSLPVSGLLAYRYLGGMSRLRNQLRFGVLSLTHHQSATRLLAERQALVAELERAKDDYLAATRGSSF